MVQDCGYLKNMNNTVDITDMTDAAFEVFMDVKAGVECVVVAHLTFAECSTCNPGAMVAPCGAPPPGDWRKRGGQQAYCSSACLAAGKHVDAP